MVSKGPLLRPRVEPGAKRTVTEPAQGVQDFIQEFLLGPAGVGVFDPEKKPALFMPGEQPVEQGRPGRADV